eukprot:scaffold23033_cov32-Phaeocystis_antarctica.AAC.1
MQPLLPLLLLLRQGSLEGSHHRLRLEARLGHHALRLSEAAHAPLPLLVFSPDVLPLGDTRHQQRPLHARHARGQHPFHAHFFAPHIEPAGPAAKDAAVLDPLQGALRDALDARLVRVR